MSSNAAIWSRSTASDRGSQWGGAFLPMANSLPRPCSGFWRAPVAEAVAQGLAIELADRRLGYLVDEDYLARLLVGSDLLGDPGDQGLRVLRRAGTQRHHRDDGLDPFVVGQSDHRALAHRLVGEQGVLDFARVDVVAAADDHVRAAVLQVEEAFSVELADVAGAHPAIGHEGGFGKLGRLVVARDAALHAYRDLAGLAGRYIHAVVVEQPDLDIDRGLAAGCEPVADMVLGTQHRQAQGRLGLAEVLPE